MAEEGELPEDPATQERLMELLDSHGLQYSLTEHQAVRTSEEAAAVRGVSLDSGAKAMLVKAKGKGPSKGEAYFLAVMSASRKLSWKMLKKELGVRDVRLATPEEVWELSGCRPGAVPPFGSLFAGTTTVCDASLQEQGDTMNFNCGLRTRSVRMTVRDYLSVEQPMMKRFCEG
eukprot:CAMPEP_0117680820 /NCGR_PEP_ID=MMETSP0804-20121206/18587_1 /TAXON_ID=1074897 /ORGANISM="Tetraselmis astigmatica, Strain CCMP880" /LENGTH=173 /DNA_ID=CAMNT_0005490405 /DNA_START=272 /DNA_END=793 /DNA_ORIENTATION=+